MDVVLNQIRTLVAYPKLPHPETGLDMAYLSPRVVVTSGPAAAFPQAGYRTSLVSLKAVLEARHGPHWCLWNFCAEPSNYTDLEVEGRVIHFPFPDHGPPPFAMIEPVARSLAAYLAADPANVAVLHCKAGKGRSGLMWCAFVMYQNGLTPYQAGSTFTAKRMRPGFGHGVSIESQRRYLRYWDVALHSSTEYRRVTATLNEIIVENPPFPGMTMTVYQHDAPPASLTLLYRFDQSEPEAFGDLVESSRRRLRVSPSSPVRVAGDLKVVFSHQVRGVPVAVATLWFNLWFEPPTGAHALWTDTDGYKGTAVRGLQLFDGVHVSWTQDD